MSRLVGMHHGASDSATLGGGMGRAKGRRVSAQSPLGASLVGSPRQERALAAAAAGPREPFPIAQRQPSPLGGMGDAVCSSADAEPFSYERF